MGVRAEDRDDPLRLPPALSLQRRKRCLPTDACPVHALRGGHVPPQVCGAATVRRCRHRHGARRPPQIGFDAIDSRIADLQAQFPGFDFVAKSPVDVMHGVGRLAWGFGPTGSAPVVAGMDIAVTEGDKTVSLYAFVDA